MNTETNENRTHERPGVVARGRAAGVPLASVCALCGVRAAEGEKDGIPVCLNCFVTLDVGNDRPSR